MHTFCEYCEQTKKDLSDSKIKLEEFKNLAKKIVQTDILFKKISKKEAEVETLRAELATSKNEQSQLNEKLKSLAKENEIFNKKNKNLSKELIEKQSHLDDANSRFKKENEDELIKLKNEIQTLNQTKITDINKLKSQSEKFDEINKDLETLRQLNFESLKNENENLNTKIVAKESKDVFSPRNPSVVFTISSHSSSPVSASETETIKTEPFKTENTFNLSDDDENDKSLNLNVILPINKDEANNSTSINLTEVNEVENLISITDLRLEMKNTGFDTTLNYKSDENDSSSSTSSSTSSSDSDSESDDKEKSPGKNPEDPFGFCISDEDDDDDTNEKNENDKADKIVLTEDSMIENKQIDEKFEKVVPALIDQTFTELINQEINEYIKANVDLEIKKNQLNDLTDQVFNKRVENFLEDCIYKTSIEYNHCEFYLEKLITETTKTQTRLISNDVLNEETVERKRLEKQIYLEIKEKTSIDILDSLIDIKVDSMLQECCERVITECHKERLESIYMGLLDEVLPKLIEKELFQIIFDEMNQKPKITEVPKITEILNIIDIIDKKVDNQTKLTPTPQKKRPLSTEVFKRSTMTKLNESPLKRAKISDDMSLTSTPIFKQKSRFEPSEPTFPKKNHSINNKAILTVKNYLAEYIKAYNYKSPGFSYEKLDSIIQKIESLTISSQGLANILVNHYINNSFIPLDEQKTSQQDLHELNLFRDLNTLFEMKAKTGGHTSSMHLSYKQNKVDKFLNTKITNEEEKYVYLLKKLSENEHFRQITDEFLMHLKAMILSADFTDHYNYRIGRIICFICKQTENFEYIRCLIYDLIAVKNLVMPLTFHKIIILFARIWPDILQWPFSAMYNNNHPNFDYSAFLDLSSSANPVLYSIIYIVKNHLNNYNQLSNNYSNEAMHSKYYSYILETLCNWSLDSTDTQEILKQFNNDLNRLSLTDEIFILNDKTFKLTPFMFEYLQSFKLLCLNEGWEWTVDKFLKIYIRKSIDESTAKTGSTSSVKSKRLLAFYLLVQGNIISSMCPKGMSNIAIETMLSFELIIKKEEKVVCLEDFAIECVCIGNLLHLASFDPVRVMRQIEGWLVNYQNALKNFGFTLPDSLVKKIMFTYEFYKKRLPHNIVISI